MSNSDDQIRRAIRHTPVDDRPRYAEEWQRDLNEAKARGPAAETEAGRGALRMAAHLRERWLGRLLLGGLGPVRAILGWAILATVALAAFLLGNVVVLLGLVAFIVTALILARAGAHTTWSYAAMVLSVVLGTAAAAYVWWVLGAKIDAADAMTPEPEAARFGGTALVVVGLSVLSFIVSVIFAGAREARIDR
ncbi:hypothetical protein [Sinomonas terrae]|uniref:Transmembrane protein n=1 Tax=Sinomonas terrae TaxID=2908838 RepID=A0ABS9U0X5_9MICC|nr:hypothetical protein [Sinomonas terrae]MCH6470246.1 hypothetical protein [Sinomonas terrae]